MNLSDFNFDSHVELKLNVKVRLCELIDAKEISTGYPFIVGITDLERDSGDYSFYQFEIVGALVGKTEEKKVFYSGRIMAEGEEVINYEFSGDNDFLKEQLLLKATLSLALKRLMSNEPVKTI